MSSIVQPPGPRWFEEIPPGARVLLGVVRIELASPISEEDLARDDVMERWTRYARGVEAIARAFDAVEPLRWEGDRVTLFLRGEPVASVAWRAALRLWERARLELCLPARIGAGVAEVEWPGAQEDIAGAEVARCERLEGIAPEGAVMVSEDVYLGLSADERRELAIAGVVAGDDLPVYVFPPSALERVDPAAVVQADALRLWASLRAYAEAPEIRRLRYAGFRLQRREPPTLDLLDVFEPLEVEPIAREDAPDLESVGRALLDHETGAGAAAAPLEEEPWALRLWTSKAPPGPAPFREAFQRSRSLVLLGDPGAGKTTLLRWLAVVAAGGRASMHASLGVLERVLPLLFSVGRLAEIRHALESDAPPLEAALRYLADRRAAGEEDLRRHLPAELEAGRCLVLLDGLDEVRSEERTELRRWLEALAAAYPRNRIVASSRRVGYGSFALPAATEWRVLPFTDAHVESYLRSFQRAYLAWELSKPDDRRADEESAKLLATLRSNPRLSSLARNPFLLSALALVQRAEGRLPRHRVQLYELFARALCETWGQARRLVATGDPEEPDLAYEGEAVPVLGRLALAMHEHHPAGVAPRAFVLDALETALRDLGRASGDEPRQAAEAFLRKAGEDVQILVERGAGAWGFLHLTFQEFFVAAGLHAEERFEEVALEHLFEPRWQEVLRLGVGYMVLAQKRPLKARRFIQRVLESRLTGEDAYITSELEKQVPIAALLLAEAGDAVPRAEQEDLLERLVSWALAQPATNVLRPLAELSTTEVAPLLGERFARLIPDPPAAVKATVAIQQLRFRGAIGPLLAALKSSDAQLASTAAGALGTLGSGAAVPVLRALAFGHDPNMIFAAFYALKELDPDALEDEFRKRLGDLDGEHAMKVLLPFTFSSNSALKKLALDKADSVLDARTSMMFRAIMDVLEPQLDVHLEKLQSMDPMIRMLACIPLSHSFRTAEVVDVLIGLIDDENPSVREIAAISLMKRGIDQGFRWVDQALQLKEFSHLLLMISALEASPHPRAEPLLRTLAQDGRHGLDPWLSLAKRGARDAIEPLTRALRDQPPPEVRDRILEALWKLSEQSPPASLMR